MQPNTLEVLKARYFLKDKEGNICEDWDGLCKRTANRAAEGVIGKHPQLDPDALAMAKKFRDMQFNREFLANSPVYFNIGTKHEMGSACFILPVGDSIREIYAAVRNGAIIEKFGGGIGMGFGTLRPENAMTSTGGIASGAVSFMQAFDTMTETIKQGGKRRGAMKADLPVDHPEVLRFIDCKEQTPPERVEYLAKKYKLIPEQAEEVLKDLNWRAPYSNFNISVGLTDEFMKLVTAGNGDMYTLRNPDGSHYRGKFIDPRNEEVITARTADGALMLSATAVMDRIIEKAWATGEPGIYFIDRINADNPVASLGKIVNSNPCGEYWQIPHSSCNLGSINLARFVLNRELKEAQPEISTWQTEIDWESLAEDTHLAVQFLEGILNINQYPIEEITKVTRTTRPIGLGVMGFADMLLRLGIKYGSADSIVVAQHVMLWIEYHAWQESCLLAQKYGAFEHYADNEKFFVDKFNKLDLAFSSFFAHGGPWLPAVPDQSLSLQLTRKGVRHCQVTTIAPTGTIALVAECSHSIEPIFAFELERRDTVSTRQYFHWFPAAWEEQFPGKDLPDYAVEAHDVTPEEHVLIQASFQKYSDNAVSKTVNLSSGATKEDVANIYKLAYSLGIKSVTVYRDGSREGVLIHNGKDKKPELKAELVEVKTKQEYDYDSKTKSYVPKETGNAYIHRPEFLPGATWKIKAPTGTVYVTVNYSPEEKRIIEVFIRENSGNEAWELTGRLLSVLLRSRTSIKQVSKQLLRTRGQSTIVLDGQILTSVAQAIAVILEEAEKYFGQPVLPLNNPEPALEEETSEEIQIDQANEAKDRKRFLDQNCPDCGGHTLYRTEGCIKCIREMCGYNKCGG